MANDLYDDGGDDASSAPTEEQDKEGEATSLLPKSFFGDKAVEKGKRCEVEITAIYDDQVQVTKVPESDYKDEPEEVAATSEVDTLME